MWDGHERAGLMFSCALVSFKLKNLRPVTRAVGFSVLSCLAACTTAGQRQTAVEQVNTVWRSDNEKTRATLEDRLVSASFDQSIEASEQALSRIGFGGAAVDKKSGQVATQRRYSNAAWSWSPAVKQAEEPRLKQIFVQTIGPQGYFLALDPKDEILTATVNISAVGKKQSKVAMDFRSSNAPETSCEAGCVVEIPPAALRAAVFEFWSAFDEELADIQAKSRLSGRKLRVQPARENRQPNDWVVPPKGWVLPKQH